VALADVLASPAIEVSTMLELLDGDDALIEDVSADFEPAGSEVTRSNLAKIHGQARLRVGRDLTYYANRLRLSMTLTDKIGGETVTSPLGIWLPETPRRTTGKTPEIYDLDAVDKLTVLDVPYGSTYRAASGAAIISTIEALIVAAGETSHAIDQTDAAKTLASERIWQLDDANTYLRIVNDLLTTIGYRGLYVDAAGYYRSEPYESPASRAVSWAYDATSETTLVSDRLDVEADYYAVPNKWIFVRNDASSGVAIPVEGTGLYTVTNQADGPTSINSRGRTIPRIVPLDVVDQASLVRLGDRIVELDRQSAETVKLASVPNPAHWHADVVTLTDPGIGYTAQRLVETGWSLPLDGSEMSHDLRKVGV
jgi:hypothetical protein